MCSDESLDSHRFMDTIGEAIKAGAFVSSFLRAHVAADVASHLLLADLA
jgi:hypothetical protein